jgi:hypothetical protein
MSARRWLLACLVLAAAVFLLALVLTPGAVGRGGR